VQALSKGVPQWGLYRTGDSVQLNSQITPYTWDMGVREGFIMVDRAVWTPDVFSVTFIPNPTVITMEGWFFCRTADSPAFMTLRQVMASARPSAPTIS
jgi:hypothetical protein